MSLTGSESEARRRTASQQARAVGLLARGWQYSPVGDEVGVSARTIRRWMADVSFRKRVDEERLEIRNGLAGELTEIAGEAMLQLERILVEGTDGQRLAAARMALEFSGRFHRDIDLDRRVAALEHSGESDAIDDEDDLFASAAEEEDEEPLS